MIINTIIINHYFCAWKTWLSTQLSTIICQLHSISCGIDVKFIFVQNKIIITDIIHSNQLTGQIHGFDSVITDWNIIHSLALNRPDSWAWQSVITDWYNRLNIIHSSILNRPDSWPWHSVITDWISSSHWHWTGQILNHDSLL